jgi:divalent metal cation (Fe/Co/Zn/Cd) transporter
MGFTIEDLKAKISNLELGHQISGLVPKSSGWLSRKMLVTLAVVAGVLWLGRGNLMQTIQSIVYIVIVWLIVQTVQDVVHSICDAYVRGKLIDGAARDGLTADEVREIAGGIIKSPTQINS